MRIWKRYYVNEPLEGRTFHLMTPWAGVVLGPNATSVHNCTFNYTRLARLMEWLRIWPRSWRYPGVSLE